MHSYAYQHNIGFNMEEYEYMNKIELKLMIFSRVSYLGLGP